MNDHFFIEQLRKEIAGLRQRILLQDARIAALEAEQVRKDSLQGFRKWDNVGVGM